MSFWNSKNAHRGVVLVVDIGSASIGGALVDWRGEKPRVLFTARVPIAFQEHVDARRFLAASGVALETLGKRITDEYVKKTGGVSVGHTTVMFSSPWLLSRPISIHYTDDKPFSLNENLIKHLQKGEEDQFSKTVLRSSSTLIESRIVGLALNGYPISYPAGQKGTSLTVRMFFSAAANEAIKMFSKIIHSTLHVDDISYTSFLFAYYKAILQGDDALEDFICLDITGEVTDILVANQRSIVNVSSFPTGVRTIARNVAGETGMPGESALALERIYGKKEKGENKADKVLEKGLLSWRETLKETFTAVGEGSVLPRKLFVTVDNDVEPAFLSELAKIEYDVLGVSKEPFDITSVTSDIGKGRVESEAGKTTDPFLCIGILFLKGMSERE